MNAFFRRIFNKNNKQSIFAVSAAGMLALILATTTVVANGPTFNIFPVAYDGSTNTDYPLIDARNVTKGEGWSMSQPDHDAGITADPNDEIEFLVYYHNGAPDDPANTALSTIVRASVPSTAGNLFTVGASIGASNAPTVSSASRGGDMVVRVNGTRGQTLTLVPGTTVWLPDRASRSQTMPDTITGSGINIGDIRGCWQFAGFVKFKVRVSNTQDTYSLSITKNVRLAGAGSYAKSVAAAPGDTVEFQIVGANTGTGPIGHLYFSDALPSRLTYVAGSLTSTQPPLSGDIFSGGTDVGTVNAGASVTVTFRATVAPAASFPVGTTGLINTASVWGQSPAVGTLSDTATVNVTVAAPSNCTLQIRATLNGAAWSGSMNHTATGPTGVSGTNAPFDYTVTAGAYVASYSSGGPAGATFAGITPTSGNCPAGGSLAFTYAFNLVQIKDMIIDKQVKNVTVGTGYADSVSAQPSQVVEFKVELRNTGNTTIDSLFVSDTLPQKMTYVQGSLTVNGTQYACYSCFFNGSGAPLDPILAGGTSTIIFRTLLDGPNSFVVGNTALVNTATAWASGIAQKSDTATVNVAKSLIKENGNAATRP